MTETFQDGVLQTLVIKAPSREQAMNYARERGFQVEYSLDTGDKTQHVVRVVPNLEIALKWYTEHTYKVPKKANSTNSSEFGTLLWYGNPYLEYEEEKEPKPKCPVTLAQILRAEFRLMRNAEYEGFAGVEGNGWIAEINECIIIYDDGGKDEGRLQVIFHDGKSWGWDISLEPTQIS